MKLKCYRYEKGSPLNTCYFKLSSTWEAIKIAIASAFALDVLECRIKQFSIILSDSQFQEEESIPTLQSYLTFRKGGVGHTIFGLYVPSEDYVEV